MVNPKIVNFVFREFCELFYINFSEYDNLSFQNVLRV